MNNIVGFPGINHDLGGMTMSLVDLRVKHLYRLLNLLARTFHFFSLPETDKFFLLALAARAGKSVTFLI
jgi:hypothetical protein